MFNKKIDRNIEIDKEELKKLKLFERIEVKKPDCNGLSIYYIRVFDGYIRCISNSETISQVFIPLKM